MQREKLHAALIFLERKMYYEVIGTDCCLVSHERMRIGADGKVGIGGENNVIERYPFLTAQMAAICADIFNRDMDRQRPLGVATWWAGKEGYTIPFNSTPDWLVVRTNNREIVRVDQTGNIVRLELPYLIWCWLRTTAPVRGAKALWKGWA